jgi:hypothetical protein
MNSGAGLRNAVLAIGALVVAAGFVPAADVLPDDALSSYAPDWTVGQLLARLKAQRSPAVGFEEKTYSSLLTEPLTVRGVLRFTPPATLEKDIQEPYRERYLIDGDRVLVESPRKRIKKTLSLGDYPGLRTLVEAFRASFTGDTEGLREAYDVTIGGGARQWTLLLRPREADAKAMVDYLLFTGVDGRIDTIAIRAPDGDRSVLTLHQRSVK